MLGICLRGLAVLGVYGRTREAVGVLEMSLDGGEYSVLSLLVAIKNGDELDGFGVGWLSGDDVVKVIDQRDDFTVPR
jgi:hypothetical protein